MDRILILMSATEFSDAQTALYSARENASEPSALSYGVTLTVEPDAEANAAMAELAQLQFLCPEEDAWRSMPALWQGESYVLMAHPAMRFTHGWDKALIRELKSCAAPVKKPAALQHADQEEDSVPAGAGQVLTGYLPVREDPLDAVCPVAADAFTVDGVLTFRHGVPLRYTERALRGPFLHPDFCFGPAGFFRAMAVEDDAPLFLRAFREGWQLYTPHTPVIRLVWDLPVVPALVPAPDDVTAEFSALFGVDFETGSLSPQSRRGMLNEELNFRMKVPLRLRLREHWRHWRQGMQQRAGKLPEPLCVTLYTADMPKETLRWLKRLAELKHLPLMAYADALLVRQITDFFPNVMELKARCLMELPVDAPAVVRTLSKAAILARARDRELTHSHYVWMDADCVQYPIYPGAAFDWQNLCTDRITIAMVGGEPDPTMFCVPDALVLTLAREMEARCLTFLNQRGDLPTEQALWSLIIREHPEWFQLMALPVARQLFTKLDSIP